MEAEANTISTPNHHLSFLQPYGRTASWVCAFIRVPDEIKGCSFEYASPMFDRFFDIKCDLNAFYADF